METYCRDEPDLIMLSRVSDFTHVFFCFMKLTKWKMDAIGKTAYSETVFYNFTSSIVCNMNLL